MTAAEDNWYGQDSATFGDRLAAARENAGMNRSQLARRLGVRKGTITSWEEDAADPRANRLSMLAGVLNVSMTWLLVGEGDGLDAPQDADVSDLGGDLSDVLRDFRLLRAEMREHAERAGQLEKKLRRMLAQSQG